MVIALAGGLGALLRAELQALGHRRSWRVGRATLLVNVLGAAALGITVGAHGVQGVPAGLGVGFLGGFTTFSTFMVESLDMTAAGAGRVRLRLGHIAAMLLLGVGGAAGGYWLGAAW